MKYIKKYEYVSELPKVGDYVIIITEFLPGKIKKFFDNNVGIITNIDKSHSPYDYKIFFENIPDEIINDDMLNIWYYFPGGSHPELSNTDFSVELRINQIALWSDNKEEVEAYVEAKKYNL